MLAGAVSFDAIWVQFYNNYCGLQSYTAGSSTQNNFNFATWDNWAKTVSLNPNVKVMLDTYAALLPGAEEDSIALLEGRQSYPGLRILTGSPLPEGPPELGEGAPRFRCEPKTKKHLRPYPP